MRCKVRHAEKDKVVQMKRAFFQSGCVSLGWNPVITQEPILKITLSIRWAGDYRQRAQGSERKAPWQHAVPGTFRRHPGGWGRKHPSSRRDQGRRRFSNTPRGKETIGAGALLSRTQAIMFQILTKFGTFRLPAHRYLHNQTSHAIQA